MSQHDYFLKKITQRKKNLVQLQSQQSSESIQTSMNFPCLEKRDEYYPKRVISQTPTYL